MLSDEHFGCDPRTSTGPTSARSRTYAELLKRIADAAFKRAIAGSASPVQYFRDDGGGSTSAASQLPHRSAPHHFFLQDTKCLVDIVVANKDLQMLHSVAAG